MTFAEVRAAFPVLARLAYLNAGTTGPLPQVTLDASAARVAEDGERGRTGAEYLRGVRSLRERVREKLAALVDVPAERVALTSSTTEACRIVVSGLRLRPEDEVVTTDSEHFGLIGPLHASGARVRVARVLGRPAGEAFDAMLAEVTPRTRLIAAQHVSWMTGHVLPLGELKQATGVPVLADGAQAAGAIRVAASDFDFYTVSAHKWLCAPDATGALVVMEPEALPVTLPSYFSQERYEPDGRFVPRPGAARFDPGWLPTPSLAGLEAALDFHPGWRFERAAEMAARCRELLAECVNVVTEPGHATLVSFRARDAAATAARAGERGVLVRDIPETDLVRASCGYWTSDEDLQRLVEAVA